MNKQSQNEINEIIEKIRAGEYRMINSKVDPLQRLYITPDLPKGQWIPLKKHHRNTIRAVQRRLVYRFDKATLQGVYEVAA